jgi:hypothetical protein
VRSLYACLLACAAAAAGAAEPRPEQFAYAVPVQIDGAQALQRLEIPQSAYEGAARADLGDLRVFNGAGEPVPYAFMPRPAPGAEAAAPRPLRYFPLRGASGTAAEALRIRVQRSADGTVVRVTIADSAPRQSTATLVGYLVDATALKQPLAAIELDWRGADDLAGSLRVEGSDDLARWTTLAAAAPLVSLRFGGQRLEQKSVELPAARYKYLRLSWPAQQAPIDLTALRGRPRDVRIEPERRWKTVAAGAAGEPGEYVFDLGGRLPVDRLRIGLPQPNTLASVQVLARNGDDQPWGPICTGVLYRLQRDGAEIVNPDLAVAGSGWRFWLLRVDQKGGGIGQGEPALEAGWVPQQLVFVARGDPPFQLAYGNAVAQPTAFPVATVVPGWRSDEELKAALATAGAQRELAGARALRAPIDIKTWALWGSLVLAVAVLGWMAWQLTRQMQPPKT